MAISAVLLAGLGAAPWSAEALTRVEDGQTVYIDAATGKELGRHQGRIRLDAGASANLPPRGHEAEHQGTVPLPSMASSGSMFKSSRAQKAAADRRMGKASLRPARKPAAMSRLAPAAPVSARLRASEPAAQPAPRLSHTYARIDSVQHELTHKLALRAALDMAYAAREPAYRPTVASHEHGASGLPPLPPGAPGLSALGSGRPRSPLR